MKTVPKNYFIVFVLVLIFATPGFFAYFFYTHPDWLGATATTNKGRLLKQPIVLAEIGSSKKSTTKVLDFSSDRKWHLLLWSPSACDTHCLDHLNKLVRVRLALGRQLYNVIPQLLLGAEAPNLSPNILNTLKDQGVEVVRLAKHDSSSMLSLTDKLAFFIANPDNYLVLVYQPSVKPDAIFQDIKHLLTTTQKTGN